MNEELELLEVQEDQDFNSALYGYLKENGVISVEDEYDGSDEGIQSLIEKSQIETVNQRLQGFLETLPPENRQIVQAAMQGQPLDSLIPANDVQEQTFDITTEDGAAALVLDEFKAMGISESDAQNLIALDKDENKLTARAEAILAKRQETQQAKAKEAETQRAQELQTLQKEAEKLAANIQSEIGELKWEKPKSDSVYNLIFTSKDGMPAFQHRLIQILEERNPKNLLAIAEFMHYYDAKEGLLDTNAYRGVQQKKMERKMGNISNLKKAFQDKGLPNLSELPDDLTW